jgi:hypothetical protein
MLVAALGQELVFKISFIRSIIIMLLVTANGALLDGF